MHNGGGRGGYVAVAVPLHLQGPGQVPTLGSWQEAGTLALWGARDSDRQAVAGLLVGRARTPCLRPDLVRVDQDIEGWGRRSGKGSPLVPAKDHGGQLSAEPGEGPGLATVRNLARGRLIDGDGDHVDVRSGEPRVVSRAHVVNKTPCTGEYMRPFLKIASYTSVFLQLIQIPVGI